jgi:hypothetical protein
MFLTDAENNIHTGATGKSVCDLAQSETLSTWRRSLTGTWEISILPVYTGRSSKAQAVGLA